MPDCAVTLILDCNSLKRLSFAVAAQSLFALCFVERYLNDVADSVISVTSPRMGARFGAQPLTIEAHATIHGNTAFQPLISPRKCILL